MGLKCLCSNLDNTRYKKWADMQVGPFHKLTLGIERTTHLWTNGFGAFFKAVEMGVSGDVNATVGGNHAAQQR
jgi:hypothetical protein